MRENDRQSNRQQAQKKREGESERETDRQRQQRELKWEKGAYNMVVKRKERRKIYEKDRLSGKSKTEKRMIDMQKDITKQRQKYDIVKL